MVKSAVLVARPCADLFSSSCVVELLLLFVGDGEREDPIHDFRAKDAIDSDMDFLLFGCAGLTACTTSSVLTGGLATRPASSTRSLLRFSFCIHDFGLTRDFLLPTLDILGRSSLPGLLDERPSRFSSADPPSWFPSAVSKSSSVTFICVCSKAAGMCV